ncbi:MAG: matrixin family metalloprotease [Myxococcales bacterium]|nr:matrixin family metalloprotease [Myxococcales bacterium]
MFWLSAAWAYSPLFTCNNTVGYAVWTTDSHWRVENAITGGARHHYSLLDDQAVVDALTGGFEVWEDPVSCCSSFRHVYDGTTSATGYNTNDSINAISFEEGSWDPANGSVNVTIAVTYTGAFGCSLHADQIYNGVGFDFTTTNSPGFGDTDLQSIAAHEHGHWLGLGHTPINGSTMFASYGGGIGPRSLGSDDEAGVCALYPDTCGPDEICDDGIDNDFDGDFDCDDLDCADDGACLELQCSDGFDDDGDQLVDCADPDCAGQPACVCAATSVLPCDTTVTGTTVGGVNTVQQWACANWTTTGPEKTYEVTFPQAGTATVTVSNLGADLDLFITDDANAGSCNPNFCISQGSPGTSDEVRTFTIDAGETIAVVLDGFQGASSDFTIHVDCPGVTSGGDADTDADADSDADADADADSDADADTDTDSDTDADPTDTADPGPPAPQEPLPTISGELCGCRSTRGGAGLLALLPALLVLRRR